MKKWIALLLAFCLLLPGAALCEEAAAPAESAEEAQGPALEDIRYYFEHQLLPDLFYEDPGKVLGYLQNNPLFALWQSLCESIPFDVTYPEDAFGALFVLGDDVQVLARLDLPRPEATPQCSRIYLYWNQETGSAGYYTVEYDNFLEESEFLCGWTKDHEHTSYASGAMLNPESPDYAEQLALETGRVMELALGDAGTGNAAEGAGK